MPWHPWVFTKIPPMIVDHLRSPIRPPPPLILTQLQTPSTIVKLVKECDLTQKEKLKFNPKLKF